MPRKSTIQAMVYILHLIYIGLDTGHCYARLFFVDFRKGFDLVDHVIISELHNLNVHPNIIRRINCFLTGLEQSVNVAIWYLHLSNESTGSTLRRSVLFLLLSLLTRF